MPSPVSGTPIDIDGTLAANSDSLVASQKAGKTYTDAQIATITNRVTGVVSGCQVIWTGLLNFTVTAGTYQINGVTYTLAADANLTLAAADATNDRFDVIVVNTSSAAAVVQGTPANPALIPTVSATTQLYLTAISVPANSIVPGNTPKIIRPYGVTVDGGGKVVTTGVLGYFITPVAGKIRGWSITAVGTSPTCTIDVWKIGTGTALPTVSNTIMGVKPALSTGNAIRSSTLTSWSVNFSAGDIFGYNLDAVTVATRISFIVEVITQ